MIRTAMLALVCAAGCTLLQADEANAQQAYGQNWASSYNTQDWERFYHYPYVYYPQNFYGNDYYRSSDSMYYRYPPEMGIPVYNKQWHNYYPAAHQGFNNGRSFLRKKGLRYHRGHQFVLDVF